jgi:hypothetical protein
VRRRKKPEVIISPSRVGRLAAAIGQNPREFVGIVTIVFVTLAIFINALFLQISSHSPLPVFEPQSRLSNGSHSRAAQSDSIKSGRSVEVGAQGRSQLVSDIQRELSRRGFYAGEVDGIWDTKTGVAAHDFVRAAGLVVSPAASDSLLRAIIASGTKVVRPTARKDDPIAALIEPSMR